MVSVRFNQAWWGQDYDWAEQGDEWSRPWGGAEAQWFGSLFPRIHPYLPAGEILEIACGYGRWTQFLKDHCDRLTAIDLSQTCVDACRERFADDPRLRFLTTDGTSVPEVGDASIDFAFSFDSLVHADQDVLTAYMAELRRVLKPEGVAFIHHSNLGAYAHRYALLGKVPRLLGGLRRLRVLQRVHMRDAGVSAESVAAAAEANGLRCIGQEITPWLERRSTMIDCMSLIVPAESAADRSNRVVRNRQFHREPRYVARVAQVYQQRPDLTRDGA